MFDWKRGGCAASDSPSLFYPAVLPQKKTITVEISDYKKIKP